MFCSVAMQNYFPEMRRGRPVSMKTREGVNGGKEREGSDFSRQYGESKVRVEVRCGLWVGQSEDGVPLRVKDDAHLSAEAQGGSPQVTQCRHFVTLSENQAIVSGILVHAVQLHPLHHDATSHLWSHHDGLQTCPTICLY